MYAHIIMSYLHNFFFIFLLFNAAYTPNTWYRITPLPNLQLLCVATAPICSDWQVTQQSTIIKSQMPWMTATQHLCHINTIIVMQAKGHCQKPIRFLKMNALQGKDQYLALFYRISQHNVTQNVELVCKYFTYLVSILECSPSQYSDGFQLPVGIQWAQNR